MILNSRSSLDPRWTRHHTPVAVGFMIATIKIVRKVPGAPVVYDQNTGTYSSGVLTIFEGKARVQPFGIMGDMVVGQDTTSRRLVRVQVEETNTGANVDDILYIVECADNPELTTYSMEVRNVVGSSNAWLTDIVCEADAKHG